MSMTVLARGQTDVTTYFIAVNNADSTRNTSMLFSTTNLNMNYTREREATVGALTGGTPAPVDLASPAAAHADWGFKHVIGGLCRVDWPDAAFAVGASPKLVALDVFGPTGVSFVPAGLVDLTTSDPRAAAITDYATATNLAALDTKVTTGNSYIDTEVAAILAAVDTEVAAIKAKTDLIQSLAAMVDAINDDAETRLGGFSATATTMVINGRNYTITRDATNKYITGITLVP